MIKNHAIAKRSLKGKCASRVARSRVSGLNFIIAKSQSPAGPHRRTGQVAEERGLTPFAFANSVIRRKTHGRNRLSVPAFPHPAKAFIESDLAGSKLVPGFGIGVRLIQNAPQRSYRDFVVTGHNGRIRTAVRLPRELNVTSFLADFSETRRLKTTLDLTESQRLKSPQPLPRFGALWADA